MSSKRDAVIARILENMPLPALIANPITGRILWTNSRLRRWYGAEDPEALKGKSVLDFVQPPLMAKALADLARVVAGQSPPPVTYKLKRADGGFAAGQVSSIPLSFMDQPAMLSFVADVTEHEQLVVELRENEERHRVLLDGMPGGVLVAIDELVTYANSRILETLGIPEPSGLIGERLVGFLDSESRARVKKSADAVLKTGVSMGHHEEVILVRADGSGMTAVATWSQVTWQGVPAVQSLIYCWTGTATPDQAPRL